MKAILHSLFIVLAFQNATAQWSNLGLNNYSVNDLTIYGDTIYASTNEGILKKTILSEDTLWEKCGLQEEYVTQTLVKDYKNFISIVQIGATYTTQIYQSVNGGNSFELMHPDTSKSNEYQFLDHVAHSANFDSLYFLKHNLKTFDGGNTWFPITHVNGVSHRFIKLNPSNTSQLIMGGESGFFSAFLQVSNDLGNTWDYPSMTNYFNGDNVVHDLAIDGETWYSVGEGIVNKSTDGGETWSKLIDTWHWNDLYGLYMTNIDFSPVNKSTIYVSGFNSLGLKRVSLLYSNNKGVDWDTTSFRCIADKQKIKCLAIENIAGLDYVFLGGKGVYLYKKTPTGVAERINTSSLSILPNPSTGIYYLSGDFNTQNTQISVHSLSGKLQHSEKLSANKTINISHLPKGIYFLELDVEGELVRKKIVKE